MMSKLILTSSKLALKMNMKFILLILLKRQEKYSIIMILKY